MHPSTPKPGHSDRRERRPGYPGYSAYSAYSAYWVVPPRDMTCTNTPGGARPPERASLCPSLFGGGNERCKRGGGEVPDPADDAAAKERYSKGALEGIAVRRSRKPIVIASRRSRLARVQAEMVGRALARLHPRVAVEYRWIESEGDRTTGSLVAHGGKGLFTRALEQALLNREADLAVHSLKDLPAQDTPGLKIAAIPKRADVRDCLVARDGVTTIEQLPEQAVVGTSSPRRAAQLRRLRPDARVVPIRGNVETRLAKVLDSADDMPYDATLLAVAGLVRLGVTDQPYHPLAVEQILPAASQGCWGFSAVRTIMSR